MKGFTYIKLKLLFGLLFVFLSCKSIEKEALTGVWSIDEIIFNQQDISRCMLVNTLNFESNKCVLPNASNCEDISVNDNMAIWEVQKSDTIPVFLVMRSKNPVFNGEFRVVFEEDVENKLLRMTMISETTFIHLRKGLFDFERKINDFRDLIKDSQKGL